MRKARRLTGRSSGRQPWPWLRHFHGQGWCPAHLRCSGAAYLGVRPLLETSVRYVVTIMLVVVAVIHLLPLSGVLGSERLSTLYGISFDEPNLAILMRHRAVLFGLLGLFLLFAAFRPAFQLLAFTAGFVSVLSFLWLACQPATTTLRSAECSPPTSLHWHVLLSGLPHTSS